MSFILDDLHKVAADNNGTIFWTYRTKDRIYELSENEYWLSALGAVSDGDIIFAISQSPDLPELEAAQFLVAKTFRPENCIVVKRFNRAT